MWEIGKEIKYNQCLFIEVCLPGEGCQEKKKSERGKDGSDSREPMGSRGYAGSLL